ncbi:MAG: ABC transporter ATP-binding protein, partial [Candidatus Limnocylindrales bacterium]
MADPPAGILSPMGAEPRSGAQPGPASAPASPKGPPPAIVTDRLVKRYGSTVALDGLTMTVPRTEVFGFLGPNGAGKTTAVKLLLGLARPTSGTATVLGRPLDDPEARRRIGYLPELFRYQPWLTGREVLHLHCRLIGLARGTWEGQVREVVALVGLEGRADERVGGYSKGMSQRIGLAVALLGAPALVFLDEPTSALDPVGRMEMRPLIRDLKARGTTVFLNSHLLTEVEQVCDRVAIVDHGRVVALGALDELLAEPVLRLRLGGVGAEARALLTARGRLAADGEWLALRGVATEAIPNLVADLVAAGVRVYAVEPGRESLEARFAALVGGEDGDRLDHAAPAETERSAAGPSDGSGPA